MGCFKSRSTIFQANCTFTTVGPERSTKSKPTTGTAKFCLCTALACLLSFCAPLTSLAEDWASLLHRVAIMKNNDDEVGLQQFLAATKRLQIDSLPVVQKDVADLSDLYERDPAIRFQIGTF